MELEHNEQGLGNVIVDEYELHDMIADMREGILRSQSGCPEEIKDGSVLFDQLRIVPKDPEKFPPELVKKWEGLMNSLIRIMGTYDADYHDDAEFTC